MREHSDWPFVPYHDCLEETGEQAGLISCPSVTQEEWLQLSQNPSTDEADAVETIVVPSSGQPELKNLRRRPGPPCLQHHYPTLYPLCSLPLVLWISSSM